MSGVVKSRREELQAPITPIAKFRSKSMERDIFYYPQISLGGKVGRQLEGESKTIKKSKITEKGKAEEGKQVKLKEEVASF